LVTFSLGFLAACAGLQNQLLNADAYPHGPDTMDQVRKIDLLPRNPQSARAGDAAGGTSVPKQVYEGTTIPAIEGAPARPAGAAAAGGDGVTLNFENTPIAAVAQSILGDILKTGYTIDPRVMGMISLSSPRPVPKSDVLFVLENALRLSGVVMVKDVQGYRLIPLGDAVGAGNLDAMEAHAEPGYGVSVVPLQYVSATTLLKLIDSFATKPGTVRADTARNMLLIQGTGAERKAAIDTVLSFDVDWMRGESVGVFPLRNTAPEPVVGELEKILDTGEGGLSQNTVKLQPITRMNAVLVVTRKPQVLHTVETWIKRLDATDTARAAVHVYHVKYVEARQLARTLNDLFGTGSGSFETPSSQTGPRSGQTSSSDRLSGGTGTGGSTFGGSSSSSTGGSGGSSGGLGSGSGFGSTSQSGSTSGGLGGGSGTGRGGSTLGRTAGAEAGISSGTQGNGQPLFENVRITADQASNTLLIFAATETYDIIARTLVQLDRPQLQVAIDATVAEVTLNDALAYGVQFYLQGKSGSVPLAVVNVPTQPPGGTGTGVTGLATNLLGQAVPGFNFMVGPANLPNMVLDALHTVTDTKVLNNPSLVVVDNQVATLLVGSDVPISTGQVASAVTGTAGTTGVVNTFDYRSVGIILRVLPRVNANGNVRLDIEQEISQVQTAGTAAAAGGNPTFSDRKVKTEVNVPNGQTVLLAGLIQEQQNLTNGGIPFVDEIPNLGDVFSHKNTTGARTELIVFLRPQIIRDSQDASYIAEELRSKLRGTLSSVAPDVPASKSHSAESRTNP
jgi:general secretion pathway protein D